MKTVIEMAIEAGFAKYMSEIKEPMFERFAALVRADEREKFTAVGEVKDDAFGGFVWNEGITSDEAPDGAVLYVRSEK